jgi:hypothetical protein
LLGHTCVALLAFLSRGLVASAVLAIGRRLGTALVGRRRPLAPWWWALSVLLGVPLCPLCGLLCLLSRLLGGLLELPACLLAHPAGLLAHRLAGLLCLSAHLLARLLELAGHLGDRLGRLLDQLFLRLPDGRHHRVHRIDVAVDRRLRELERLSLSRLLALDAPHGDFGERPLEIGSLLDGLSTLTQRRLLDVARRLVGAGLALVRLVLFALVLLISFWIGHDCDVVNRRRATAYSPALLDVPTGESG